MLKLSNLRCQQCIPGNKKRYFSCCNIGFGCFRNRHLLELSQKLLLDGFTIPSYFNMIFHKFRYNYNIVDKLGMIFLNEFNFKQSFDEVSFGENMYDEIESHKLIY